MSLSSQIRTLTTLGLAAGVATSASGQVDYMPALVTSDALGTHTTTPGGVQFGVNTDGVGDLIIDNDFDDAFDARCSASLLEFGGRRYALTAAHCLSSSSGDVIAQKVQLTWQTPTGNVVAQSTTVHTHPLFTGNVRDGFDLALVEFDAPIDVSVPAYQINRTANELNVPFVAVGYGNEGFGATGQVPGTSGTKRAGLNMYHSYGFGTIGRFPTDDQGEFTQLIFDFDSPEDQLTSANDGFSYHYGTAGPRGFFGDSSFDGLPEFGDDEVGLSQGDSGGPSFIDVDGVFQIAGVHSYGRQLLANGLNTSDVDLSLNFSWGEFHIDARVAEASMIGWIDSVIPEPGSALVLAAGVPALLTRRRRG